MAGAMTSRAQLPPPPATSLTVSNGQTRLWFEPYPAADQYAIQCAGNLAQGFTNDLTGTFSGYSWLTTNVLPAAFYRLAVTPASSNALFSANLLNRIAYGPTPDDLVRLAAIGPQAYLDEQLAPESIVDNSDASVAVTTNGITLPETTNWTLVTVTGRVTSGSSTFYLYLTTPGDLLVDDVVLRTLRTVITTNTFQDTNSLMVTNYSTNAVFSTNLLLNGDFEAALAPAWSGVGNHTGSVITTNDAHSGLASLRIVSTGIGTGSGASVTQVFAPPVTNVNVVLSFWYLRTVMADELVARLSGSGVAASGAEPPVTPTWYYVTVTGRATATPSLYMYLSGAGEAFIDDIFLARGTTPEQGTNLLLNGDFEQSLTNGWRLTADFTNSFISPTLSHSGNGSLKIVATAAGTGSGDSVYQLNIFGVTNTGTYTLSFWYLPSTQNRTLTVRLSGSLLQAAPETSFAGIRRRLDTFGGADPETGFTTARSVNGASLADLRAWFVMNAVGGKRQLLEVLTQFLENHFVTEHAKSADYFDRSYDDSTLMDKLAANWEYREISKWRAAIGRPDCTFHDLLKISAESPAMIVYLDTVDSKANRTSIANENYARELFELFCMGVDNGYDQNDIVAMSRAWTGWSVDLVDKENINNPLAPPSTTYGFYPGSGYNVNSNRVGVWSFRFKPENHGTNRAPLLSEWDPTKTNLVALGPKIVPARYGPPWAGTPYQLVIPPRRTDDTNGIRDGYEVIQHLANLPMTMEYISIKLCRLFVHDDFPNPTTKSDALEYAFYDYTRPDLSPEAKLVHDCMLAWWNSTPRGNMRDVLRTIFASELFRSHGGSMQKVKTPLEYAASTIRALRSQNPDGTFTASTDGYSISGRDRTAASSPLTRMGRMMLFDRDAPDGYAEDGSPWISAGTLAERVRFLQTALMPSGASTKTDGISGGNFNLTDPVRLLKSKLPAASWRNASDVVAYFASILYPGEGLGNLQGYRDLAVNYLNTADDGVTPSLFTNLTDTSTTYDTRVRGMVAMLMSLQRFQEQ
jgi:uncharacterized protein (DUF1800 family)